MNDTKNDSATLLAYKVARIKQYGHDFHLDGTIPNPVVDKLVDILAPMDIRNSMETGCGRSTLIFSQLSDRHIVFSLDIGESQSRVKQSPLLRHEHVEFVDEPSQLNVPAYKFPRLQLAMLDGPHAYPFPELEYFYVYPHIDPGGILVIDDISIPSIRRMFEFLREDPMWQADSVVINTAFLRRTDAPTFDPSGDGWGAQPFNARRFKGSEPKSYRMRRFLYSLSPEIIRKLYAARKH